MKETIVRSYVSLPGMKDVCGTLRVLLSDEDKKGAGFAVAAINGPTLPHYHKKSVEFYFVISGQGVAFIGGKRICVGANMLLVIDPFTAHFTIPRTHMTVLAVTVPPWLPEDQIILPQTADTNALVGYSEKEEKAELAKEVFLFDPMLALGGRSENHYAELQKLTAPKLRKRLTIIGRM